MRERRDKALADYRQTNVEGTKRLLDAAIGAGVRRFVFMSSIKAVAERSRPGDPLNPATEPHPEDPYGISKLEAEQLVRHECEKAGIEWVILRPPLVISNNAVGNLARIARLARWRIPLPLGAIRNRRSVISVENLAEAAVVACVAPGAANKVLMLCDRTVSTPELLSQFAALQGHKLVLVPFPVSVLRIILRALRRDDELDRLCEDLEIDPRSSLDALGWEPQKDRPKTNACAD
jgi:nucleoside-diphosphate-sugar epimerase